MFLDATNRKIQVILAGAKNTNDCPVVSDWVDITTTTMTPGCTVINTNGATAVDIVGSPGASTQRKVNYISIHNADVVATTATVRYNDNTTLYTLVKVILAVGDILIFTDPGGWFVQDANGNRKQVSGLVSLTTGVSGILPPANGGTGVANSKNLTVSAALTLAGTDATTQTFQASDTIVGRATTDTLTNKRITPRILSAASYTTDTGTSLNIDNLDEFIVTAQAGALKFNNPTGTPTDGQKLIIAVTGTAARVLTWDSQYEASTVALPTTTVTTARLNIGFIWRADTSKWVCVAVA